jgi:fructose-1-phosphate kinase PfkB-like protein
MWENFGLKCKTQYHTVNSQYCSSHVKEGKGGNVKLLPYFPVNDQIQTCLPKEESGFCQTLEKSEEPDKSFTVTTPTRNEDK